MDENSLLKVVEHHWKVFVAIWLAVGFVTAMPSPNGVGPTASWWYRWIFNGLHGTIGAIPRMMISLWPNSLVSKLLTNGGGK